MPWYYYGGSVVGPVQVKPGVTLAVRPHSKVEVFSMTAATQAMIRKGLLRRTGKPRDSKPVEAPKDEPKMEDVVEKSNMATKIAEKGVTTSKNQPPKPGKGSPAELTVGEEAGVEKGNADTVEPLSNDADADEKKKEQKKGAAKKRRK